MFRVSLFVADPLEGSRGNQAENQKVVATKTGRVLPGVSIFVRSLERDIEQGTFFCFLSPDAGADCAMTDFVHWLRIGLISHFFPLFDF